MISNNNNTRFTQSTSRMIMIILLVSLVFITTSCSGILNFQTTNDTENELIFEFEPILAPVLPESSSSISDTVKKIVIMNSYENGNTINKYYETGIIEGLRLMGYIEGENLEISYVYPTQLTILFESASTMIKQVMELNPDVLVITEDEAMQWTRANFFEQKTPVVFSGINISNDGSESALVEAMADTLAKPGHNITGVLERLPVTLNFDFIRQLLPEANTILLISDNSEASRDLFKNMPQEIKNDSTSIRILHHTSTNNFHELQNAVLSHQGKVDAMMFFMPTGFINENAEIVPENEVVNWIINNNKIPEICFTESAIAQGLFGGWVVDHYQLGYHAGLMAGRILEGENPAEISIINPDTYSLYINAQRTGQLKLALPDTIIYKSSTISEYSNATTSN